MCRPLCSYIFKKCTNVNISASGLCRVKTSCLEEDAVFKSEAQHSTFAYPNASYNVEYCILKNKVHSLVAACFIDMCYRWYMITLLLLIYNTFINETNLYCGVDRLIQQKSRRKKKTVRNCSNPHKKKVILHWQHARANDITPT
jgi:hypothetical protein